MQLLTEAFIIMSLGMAVTFAFLGVVIGAVGVSGDGIDQDDIIAASGVSTFPSVEAIRADLRAAAAEIAHLKLHLAAGALDDRE